jgi:hypothetical protein
MILFIVIATLALVCMLLLWDDRRVRRSNAFFRKNAKHLEKFQRELEGRFGKKEAE